MRKIYVLNSFASSGVRYSKGAIVEMDEASIERFKSEGFVEEVATVLGLEVAGGGVDMSNYITTAQLEEIKPSLKGVDGKDGKDGFPTKEQWEALVTRVVQLEEALQGAEAMSRVKTVAVEEVKPTVKTSRKSRVAKKD